MTGPARDQGAGRTLACGPGARRLSSGPDDVPSWLSSHDGMMATRSWMEAPVTTYEIRVIGSFGPATREAFADLMVEVEPTFTVLSGDLDQRGLHALLDRVRALGLELVGVRQAPPSI